MIDLRSVYLQHMNACLFNDKDEGDARRPQNDNRKLHEDIGSSTRKRSFDVGLDKVL